MADVGFDRSLVTIVHLNEASSARADVMPFCGMKDSGFGRQGPAYAVREMTEERLITISLEPAPASESHAP